MALQSLTIKRFRCFENAHFALDDEPIVLIKGANGTGKTSILEALYYASHLRSFRTHIPRELIKREHDAFFLKVEVSTPTSDHHELTLGFSLHKRSIKIDGTPVTSYKDLVAHSCLVSVSEDDLVLIKGSPEERRNFIDHGLVVQDAKNRRSLSHYRQVLAQRNALLKQHAPSRHLYTIWTQQLWEVTTVLQDQRRALMNRLGDRTNALVRQFIPDCPLITFTYQPSQEVSTLEDLLADNHLYHNEVRARRSLFGAHLDDILISFGDHASKPYASRGQQKLTVLLLKVAYVKELQEHGNQVTALLVDDFMTDLDEQKMQQLLTVLRSLNIQLIFTCPTDTSHLETHLQSYKAKTIVVSSP